MKTPEDLVIAKQETFDHCYSGTGVVLPTKAENEHATDEIVQTQQRPTE